MILLFSHKESHGAVKEIASVLAAVFLWSQWPDFSEDGGRWSFLSDKVHGLGQGDVQRAANPTEPTPYS